jgi:phosphate transport system substrate-binding protein
MVSPEYLQGFRKRWDEVMSGNGGEKIKKILAIDGVYPSNETIADGSYPFADNFYAVTNGKPEGNAKLLIDWILSDEGQYLIEQTGYAPLR